jgi:RNA polymerase sigma-70 factor (ECF subfamily)
MKPLKQDARILAGADEPAVQSVEHLYRSHGAWLLGALRRRFGNAVLEIAEDLVQETYLRLAPRNIAADIQRPRALLMRIASNLALDHFRRRSVDARALARLERTPAPSPHQRSAAEAAIELREVILGLPEPLRDVFVLSRFGGLTYEEIAHHLDLSVKTVEWRMTRALAECAERLRDEKA